MSTPPRPASAFAPTSIPDQVTVDGVAFPLTLAPAVSSSATTYAALAAQVRRERQMVLEAAARHGAVLLRGFGGKDHSAEGFAAVAEALGLEKYPYVGGAAPRTNVVRDVVFTTNESPPSEPIPFHHEIAQVPDPPSYILFYCETPSRQGGETPIIRSDVVARYFFDAFPAFAREVEVKGVRYIRTMPLEDDNSSAIGRSWKSTFQCQTKAEAEAAMAKIGTEWEWLANGDVRTTSAVVPAIRTDKRTGRKMFFNSIVAAFTGWIDSRNDPTKSVVLGDGSPVNAEALLATAAFQRDNRVAFPWQAGDIIIIDNFTTMHSRNSFERPRRVLAAIGGPSLDGFATGSGIRAAEAADEGFEKPTDAVADAAADEGKQQGGGAPPPAKRFRLGAASKVPAHSLARTGDTMPLLGLGVWKVPREATATNVYEAIQAGWRHFDCACDYGNEIEVGQGIARAIAEGLVVREDLWITSKLWNTYHAPKHVEMACRKSLADLGLEYLDLYLIHFPTISLKFVPIETRYPPEWVHDPEGPNPRMQFAQVPIFKTWGAMEELVDGGLVRNIGLCNVGVAILSDVLSYARFAPQVLQVELHPYNTQENLCRYCKEKEIFVTGFSPLGAGSYVELDMATTAQSALLEPVIKSIATAKGATPAQVIMRWALYLGRSIIPKTTKTARLSENIDLFGFALSQEEVDAISALNKNMRFNDPGQFCQGMGGFCPVYE
jgi:D-xylose reductase